MTTSKTSVTDLFRHVSFFEGLSPDTLTEIEMHSTRLDLARGEVLIEEGAEADSLYFVLHGHFVVLAGETPIAIVKSGEPIGELGFFAGNRRTASVVAARNSSVLKISQAAFDELARTSPEMTRNILASMSSRLAKATGANLKIRPQAGRNVCLAPAGQGAIAPEFLDALRKVLESESGWTVVAVEDCPCTVLEDRQELLAWLKKLEQSADRLMIVCSDPARDALWFECVGEMCDSDLLVARAGPDGPVSRTSQEDTLIRNSLPGSLQLVIWRDHHADRVSGTDHWLAERPVALHHHVALDSEADFQRLSRFIKGEALGLVLCGGGALGMAHLGAMKALQERGFVFDMIGGTSIGAALSAGAAMDMAPEEILGICEDIFLKSKAMKQVTLPVHSILDPSRLDRALERHFGTVRVEDLALNYFAVATSLTTNDIFVMRSGKLWQAVRASASLPGVLPPMLTDEGDVLIDGGLIDNVPIRVARELNPGPNLVFNLVAPIEWRAKVAYADLPSRAATLWSMITRRRKGRSRFPKLFSILTRTMIVNARRLIEHTDMEDDILMQVPTLRHMGFLEWRKGRAQFDASYKLMRQALDEASQELNLTGDDVSIDLLRRASQIVSATPR